MLGFGNENGLIIVFRFHLLFKLSDGGVCPADFLFGLSYILRGHYDQLSPLLALVYHCLLYFVARDFWKPYHVCIILTQLIPQPSTLLCSIPGLTRAK